MVRTLSITSTVVALCLMLAIAAGAQQGNFVSWSGDVDQAATIYVHGHHIWINNVVGKSVQNVTSNVNTRLPVDTAVQVHLDRVRGRGSIRIVQQPTPDNNFTAAVRVVDPQPGRGHYHFDLDW